MVHVIVRGHLFTRFSVFRTKYACNESTKAIYWKGIQQRRSSSCAASMPSNIPNTPKPYKRVPIHERQVMVESFVKKYREEHGGKFPTLSLTKKEVGGCHYVIRKIVQELKYKSKIPTEGAATDVQTQSSLQNLARSDVKDDSSEKQVELEEESRGDVLEAQNCQLEINSKDSTFPCLEMTDGSELNTAHFHESQVDVIAVKNRVLEKNTNDSSHPYPETTGDDKLNNAHVQESRGAVHEAQNSVLKNDRTDSSHPCPETIEDDKLNNSYLQESHGDVLEARNRVMENDSHAHERAVDDQPSENVVHSAAGDQHGYSDIVAAESHQDNQEILSDTISKDVKDDQKKHTEFMDSVDTNDSKNDSSRQLRADIRETTIAQTNDSEISKSTLWSNLKSFAHGIINVWRKR